MREFLTLIYLDDEVQFGLFQIAPLFHIPS